MPQLSNKQYDTIKWLVQIVMPAFASAYFALSELTGLPAGGTVAGVTAILATFLGTILGVSNKKYKESGAMYDGEIEVHVDPGGVKQAELILPGDPETALETRDDLRFKVNRTSP